MSGAYKVDIDWNNSSKKAAPVSKVIPDSATTVAVSIFGEGMTYPLTSQIVRPESSIVVDNLATGYKVATLVAQDGSGNILAQRKESFVIVAATTTDSGSIPLGIAITGTTGNPVFEPSTIWVTEGETVIFQNWMNEAVSVGGYGSDLPIQGVYTASSGQPTFYQGSKAMGDFADFSLSVNGTTGSFDLRRGFK